MGLDMYLKKGKRIPRKGARQSMDILNSLNVYTRNKNDISKDIMEKYGDNILVDYTYAELDGGRPTYTTSVEIGYWRKANAIHNWFVENVQDGVDDCRAYIVTKEQLEDLLAVCKEVLQSCELTIKGKTKISEFENGTFVDKLVDNVVIKDATVAHSLLPTTSGFFFGNTDYDKWYVQDLEDTIMIIEKALQETDYKKEFIYYRSSW